MSVIAKNMKMPKNCGECPFIFSSWGIEYYCHLAGSSTSAEYVEREKMTNCPLIELPPHGRMIDATFEENHYASMLLNPTPDVTEQDKHKARIVIDALRMAKTVIEGSET